MTAAALTDPAVSRLVVTAHPNHELAILGFVQRHRPRLLFLTDGGGEERVGDTRRALAALGLEDRALFLGRTEESLYRALLAHDAAVLRELVEQVRHEIERCAARQVLCESVELYNPLHDLTLPIVRAATRGMSGVEIYEFPLIAQVPAPSETYRVQRLPAASAPIVLRLTAAELAAKLRARDDGYPNLRRQLGSLLAAIGAQHAAVEVFAAAAAQLPAPGADHVLRYEWRGRHLLSRGEIEQVITFGDHFLPAVAGLAAGSAPAGGRRRRVTASRPPLPGEAEA
jgi:glycosyltransferase involved in cell wall biosynthesis